MGLNFFSEQSLVNPGALGNEKCDLLQRLWLEQFVETGVHVVIELLELCEWGFINSSRTQKVCVRNEQAHPIKDRTMKFISNQFEFEASLEILERWTTLTEGSKNLVPPIFING